jgi:hypothetical protein
MNRLSLSFFTAATLCALTGMVWGAIMGSSENFALAPAHAHLNLVGWATLALMGTFYALSGKAGPLGWLNFALSTVGVVVMIPGLALVVTGHAAGMPAVIGGSSMAMLGMLVFLIVVISAWRQAKPA